MDINGRLLDIELHKARTLFGVVVQYAFYLAYHDKDTPMNGSGPLVSVVLQKTAHGPTFLIVPRDSIEHKPTTKNLFGLRLGVGKPESNTADYILARLPYFERQFWAPDGPGPEFVWEQIQKFALQVEHGSP